jgi:hypothetical protein
MSVLQRAADVLKPHVGTPTRRRLTRARFSAREPSASWRVLPDFLVVGAMRSGTSSLFKYLAQHPEVSPSLRKEVEYFTRNFHEGETWYRQHFTLAARRHLAHARGRPLLSFEATPYYLFEPRCPERAHLLLPEARIIALLRDPVDRAFSDFQHMCRHGFEHLSFSEALEAEHHRVGPELRRMAEDPAYFSRDHHHFSYFERGRYAPQLRRWLTYYRRDQVLLLESQDLYRRPAEVLHQVQDFLGLRRWVPKEFRNYSYVGEPPARGRVDDGLRRELRARYAPDDADLAQLWGRAPSWLRSPGSRH